MTVTACITKCDSEGWTNAGIEYASECYCGNTFLGTGGVVAADSDCSMVCSGELARQLVWFESVRGADAIIFLWISRKQPRDLWRTR